jgi:hypothetical protein
MRFFIEFLFAKKAQGALQRGTVAMLCMLLIGFFMTASCEKPTTLNTGQNGKSALQISEIQSSKCKSLAIDSNLSNVSLNYKDSFLHVTHLNALLNCAYDTVNVIMTEENNIITLQEEETPTDANCLCYVDISYAVGPIVPDTYQLFVLFHTDTVYNQQHQW